MNDIFFFSFFVIYNSVIYIFIIFNKPWSNMKILMLFHDFDVIDLLFHAKISIGMHRGGQIKNYQNTLDRAWNEIRMKNRQKISSES